MQAPRTVANNLYHCELAKRFVLPKNFNILASKSTRVLYTVEQIVNQLNDLEKVLAIIFVFALLVQLYYYLVIYIRVAFRRMPPLGKTTPEHSETPPVSVVICARNEEENLRRFLPEFLSQDYPDYEVVVVNDCSSDNTDLLLDTLAKKHKNLRFTTIKEDEKFSHTKKLALTVGIKAAKHNWLLLTDADCKPEGKQWVASMASHFTPKCEVVLGYGGYFQRKGILNRIIRYDCLFIALNYLGYALKGRPYMGVGRNLAYRKELFFKNKGFASHFHIASGDDDLFIQEVARKYNTCVNIRPESRTRSVPRTSFSQWIKQKTRHTSTSSHYRFGIKFSLTMEPFSRVMLQITTIVMLSIYTHPEYILIPFAFRELIRLIVVGISGKRLGEKKILLVSFFWDIFSPYFYTYLLIANRFSSKKTQWR